MNDSEDESGGFVSPLEDDETITDYDSATEGKTEGNLRRKMDTNGNVVCKKQKMDTGTNKNEKKVKDKNKDKSKNKTDGNDGLRDGWHKNKIFKTFILEPNEQNSEPIHIMEIARLLRNIKVTYKDLVKAGRNRFKIIFENPRHAEPLINSRVLIEDFKYKIFVPTMYKETIGVIRNVPPSISESEILNNLESDRIKITKIERIKKLNKKDLVPTYAIKIYAEGEKLPRQVRIFDLPYEVDCYVFPMKCCVRCVRYGHSTKACKSPKVRCINCSCEGHEGKDCTSLSICCWHCKAGHKAFDPECREKGRQDNIRKSMAYNKLTFAEAARSYPLPSQIQYRLQDNSQFPILTQPEIQTETPIINEKLRHNPNKPITQQQPTNNPIQNSQSKTYSNITTSEYITKTELEQIVNQLKVEIVKQLNVTKLITKIKEIQETIMNNISTTNEENSKSDNRQLLININKQLNELVNPEILRLPEPPDNKTQDV